MVQNPEQGKHLADAASITTVIAAWLGVFSTVLTIMATAATFVWFLIRIYETKTVQDWLNRR